MDIGSKRGYPAGALSNFTPRHFYFDDVECNSLEGVLQSFKYEKEHIQVEICKLVGVMAKRKGSSRNKAWKRVQTLWWKGVPYKRDSDEYQNLLTRLYDSVYEQCINFRQALYATGNAVLTHSIGRNKIQDTVLTEREFVSQLTRCRNRI